MAPEDWTERDRDTVFLDHLESRRGELAVAGWQAPTLTMAAQAFLLTVLTDETVPTSARIVILAAGITATVAAILALLRLRSREELYSEALTEYGARLAGMRDTRPFELERKPVSSEYQRSKFHRWVMAAAGSTKWPSIHLTWSFALFLFVIADVVALVSTT
jgi:hypothetical protein